MPTIVETHEEFAERHGNEPVLGVDETRRGTFVYATGAAAVQEHHPRGNPLLVEPPPEGSLRNVQIRLAYWKRRVEIATTSFNKLKATLLGRGYDSIKWESHWGPRPEGSDVEILSALKTVVETERKGLAAVKREYAGHPEVIERKRQEKARAEAEQAKADAEHQRKLQINEIRI